MATVGLDLAITRWARGVRQVVSKGTRPVMRVVNKLNGSQDITRHSR